MSADRGHIAYICQLTEGIKIMFMPADRRYTAYIYVS
jgi:hypothetical protein